jgi:hypothetical protein
MAIRKVERGSGVMIGFFGEVFKTDIVALIGAIPQHRSA